MINEQMMRDCCGCAACRNACTSDCIRMVPNRLGFLYPAVDRSKCISCGLCRSVCPVFYDGEQRSEIRGESRQECYYCYAKDNAVRAHSSSGGFFSAAADKVLRDGGVVCAASFREDFQTVAHIIVDKADDLGKLRGAKYVQSEITDCFAGIRDYLKQNRTVLFAGTPCQTAGLKRFLKGNSPSLITIDMICHGVPSPAVWKEYLAFRSGGKRKITGVNFRDKREGWVHYGLSVACGDRRSVYHSLSSDPYMLAFLNNYTLRESCYSCKFRGRERFGDITIGDAWGIEKVRPDMFDDFGASAVMLNTEAGKELFCAVRQSIVFEPVRYEDILSYNSTVEKPCVKPYNYDSFIGDCQDSGLIAAAKKYFRRSKMTIVKDRLKSVRRRFHLRRKIHERV